MSGTRSAVFSSRSEHLSCAASLVSPDVGNEGHPCQCPRIQPPLFFKHLSVWEGLVGDQVIPCTTA